MSGAVWTGLLAALVGILAFAGCSKLYQPEPTAGALATLGVGAGRPGVYVVGVAELLCAAAAAAAPSRVSGVVVGCLFGVLAVASNRLRRAGAADCGCFGEGSGGTGWAHLSLNAVVAIGAFVAAGLGPRSPVALAAASPAAIAWLSLVALVAPLAWRIVTSAPAGTSTSEKLVARSAGFLDDRFSRRSFVARATLVGTALSVAPLRYLLYPVSAMAAIVPSDCSSGDCTDGYTAFCCEINHGLNECPAGTFPGGWWKCTDYSGHRLCANEGVRYYVDCNAIPGHPFPGGCRCANGSCEHRRVNCNVFRYGQCNTHIAGVTAVVCRMVLCENPSAVAGLNCSSSLAVDDSVCAHEAECLEPAVQLVGAGGV